MKEWWKIHEDDHLANDLDKAGVNYSTITGEEMRKTADAIHAKYGIDQSP